MTHRQLIYRLAQKRSLPLATAKLSVDTLVDAMHDALVAGERIDIRRFGALFTRTLRARTNLHPQSGQWFMLPTRRVPAFRASPEWLSRLNASPWSAAAWSRPATTADSAHT